MRAFTSIHHTPLIVAAMFAASANAATYNCTTFGDTTLTPTGINNDGMIVGSTSDGHGFIRDTMGHVTSVDYPDQSPTRLFTINNDGVILGGWGKGVLGDSLGYFTRDASGSYTTVTVPAPYAGTVLLYGINDAGAISGRNLLSGTYFILKADGTATEVPGASQSAVPGSLNNSLQMLETAPGWGYGYPAAALGAPGVQPVAIPGNDPSGSAPTAFGLNNPGTVVGYLAHYLKAAPFGAPWTGFAQDASGTHWSIVCTGLSNIQPFAINDNGLVTGAFSNSSTLAGGFIATPIPGTAQYSASVSSVDFGSVPYGTPGNPMSFTVANSGSVRMDIGTGIRGPQPPFGGLPFGVSGCISQGAAVTTLQPGASCVVTVVIQPGVVPAGVNVTDIVLIYDSAPGSPHLIPVSASIVQPPPPPPAPPICTVSPIASGPPREVTFTMQDTVSGLASITTLLSTNLNAMVPPFQPGATGAITVVASQMDQATAAQINFQVMNVGGSSSTCGATIPGGISQWTPLETKIKGKVALIAIHNGALLEAFVRSNGNTLVRNSQTAPGVWSAWESLGGQIVSDPAVALNGAGGAQVFGVGTHGALWYRSQADENSDFSAWSSLGGAFAGNPVAILGDYGAEVFIRGTDSALWHIAQKEDGSWSDWTSLGGFVKGDPAVAIDADGRIEAFVRGGSGAMWRSVQSDVASLQYSAWARLGGSFVGNPVVIANGDLTLEAFATGDDNALWHSAQASADPQHWSAWTSLGGYLTSDPTLVSNNDGSLEAFVLGGDHALWHKVQTAPGGPWSDVWQTLGGRLSDQVSAALRPVDIYSPAAGGDGRVEVLGRANNGSVWDLEQLAPGLWK